ncbi:nucleotide exchange factor GrpE [Rhodococcus sp. D2-41]|uniref:nucleotide exchange factor GrpE n=1 Tax=Speluncibacter jeojiensis TaxID=2710754 RepID=UPI0024101076|nr:nucleotide exchange factor GrpE [Rhodococcus sp. D2-41]MDG3010137.1 nucleotide exchange factor GrpE [Rhodococcus sp. D2-41]
MTAENSGIEQEPVTVTDKRRIDPETGEVRTDQAESAAAAAQPAGSAPDPALAAEPEASAAAEAVSDKVGELTADLQRLQAEFVNFRKRTERDKLAAREEGRAKVITELLGVLDDLDRARAHGDLEAGPLKAIGDKLTVALNSQGVEAFGAEGDEFDPALHEAVQHEGDGSAPVLGTVMRRGYRLGDRVLRTAMVAVVDAVPEAAVDAEADQSGSNDPGAPE